MGKSHRIAVLMAEAVVGLVLPALVAPSVIGSVSDATAKATIAAAFTKLPRL